MKIAIFYLLFILNSFFAFGQKDCAISDKKDEFTGDRNIQSPLTQIASSSILAKGPSWYWHLGFEIKNKSCYLVLKYGTDAFDEPVPRNCILKFSNDSLKSFNDYIEQPTYMDLFRIKKTFFKIDTQTLDFLIRNPISKIRITYQSGLPVDYDIKSKRSQDIISAAQCILSKL